MIATLSSVITLADVEQAQIDARVAEDRAAGAWDRVEAATQEALALEARAEDAREWAKRIGRQVGFRRVAEMRREG